MGNIFASDEVEDIFFTRRTRPETDVPNRTETNLKLEAQKIKDFSGLNDDWQKWKSRTECAFSGSGYERVLEDEEYSLRYERLNRVVYSQLAAATVDGVAYHLVQEFEETKDGHAAWVKLCDWYDGDLIKNETAENLRVKLDNLVLHSGVSGSEYVNKFLAWHRDLSKIGGEGMSPNQAVYLFLKNIKDPEYMTSVTYCRNTTATLEACVAAVRKQENILMQDKIEKRRLKATIRRMKQEEDNSDEDSEKPQKKKRKSNKIRRNTQTSNDESENKKFEGELKTTERGLLRFKGEVWHKMEDKEKEFVREYNASVKHGEVFDKDKMPKGVTIKTKIRRTQIKETEEVVPSPTKGTIDKRKKGVTFGLNEEDHYNID
jgi:hypothetical protein